jgi:CubicO group peptidase (beta-lactamase class C family)
VIRLEAPASGEVTIEDMYAHRSGLPGGAGDLLEILGFDRAEILHRLRLLLLRPLRGQFAYANFGMTTGGEAAARA